MMTFKKNIIELLKTESVSCKNQDEAELLLKELVKYNIYWGPYIKIEDNLALASEINWTKAPINNVFKILTIRADGRDWDCIAIFHTDACPSMFTFEDLLEGDNTTMKIKNNIIDVFTKNVAINCQTESEAKALMKELADYGFQWEGSHNPVIPEDAATWHMFREKTCYRLNKVSNFLEFGPSSGYDSFNIEIVAFADLIEEECGGRCEGECSGGCCCEKKCSEEQFDFELIKDEFITRILEVKYSIPTDITLNETNKYFLAGYFKACDKMIEELSNFIDIIAKVR